MLEAQIAILESLSFEIGPIRPPSEGGAHSLLIRVNRNCPWNRCKFCPVYKEENFDYRQVEEVKKDIDTAKEIADIIKTVSWKLGYAGKIDKPVGVKIVPKLKDRSCFMTIFNWLYSGGRTAFLQDADALIMRTPELIEVLKYLKQTFPSLERITSYTRSKTLTKKTVEELKSLKEAGLSRLHVGLESGDDEVLKYMEKGVISKEHIIAGKRAKEASLELSEYVMPGLGGRARWIEHAQNTAAVLNEIDPDFIRMRPLIPPPGTPLFGDCQSGVFELTSYRERLKELQLMIESLEITGRVCFDHFLNFPYKDGRYIKHLFDQSYEGYKFSERKQEVLNIIRQGFDIDESEYFQIEDIVTSETIL